jgi:beta-glucanase (GH16 family)
MTVMLPVWSFFGLMTLFFGLADPCLHGVANTFRATDSPKRQRLKTFHYISLCVALLLGSGSLPAQEFFDDFTGAVLDTTKWEAPDKVWGNVAGKRTNGGIVPQNVQVRDGNLVIEAHGNRYKGPVAGHGMKQRTGGAAATLRHFASGRYEVRAKICLQPGALSAFWTFYYENDDYNHEIDFEMPGNNQAPHGPANSSLNHGLMTSWRGVNPGQYHTTDTLFKNQADGNYHLYRFEWHTGGNGQAPRVEWYYDDVLLRTNTNPALVPSHEGYFKVGIWFPWWIGEPDFAVDYMYVDWVRITPFHEPNDIHAPEKRAK